MLIDEPKVLAASNDPILALIATVNGREPGAVRLQQGVYEVGHYGSSSFMRGYDEYPNLGPEHGSYGVCDGAENALDVLKVLQDPARQFVLVLTKVTRDKENAGLGGGWRWHKWGEYIGRQQPTTEYLDDEPEIDSVYCYHVYERATASA